MTTTTYSSGVGGIGASIKFDSVNTSGVGGSFTLSTASNTSIWVTRSDLEAETAENLSKILRAKCSDLILFSSPDIRCPLCGDKGHSVDESACKNPIVSIRSEFVGCRRCYDKKYTGLANRYLYDMCRLMGLRFDWLD